MMPRPSRTGSPRLDARRPVATLPYRSTEEDESPLVTLAKVAPRVSAELRPRVDRPRRETPRAVPPCTTVWREERVEQTVPVG